MDFTKMISIVVVIAVVIGFFASVSFTWDLDTNQHLNTISSFLSVVFFILPIDKLSPIIFTFLGLVGFKISISIIKVLWQLLPIH